ncbi:MAG: flippase-like domain-containing protein [Flavobacteriales bacterium]|nr:flippase-like domain-containing protein [Flavobacteriales bacterium]
MSRRTLLLLRWGVFLLACLFLYVRLSRQQGDLDSAAMFQALREPRTLLVIAVACVLMLLNWGLESRKWRILVSDVERISRWRAFMATLAGTPIGLITPNRVGEFVGRVLFFGS